MSQTAPLVSICIPVYNGAEFIAEAVESALAQGYPNLEIVIQDNASTDNTWEIVSSLASKYPQLSIERNETNIGMSPNWNRAMGRASGDYVLLMSADDYLEPGFLKKSMAALAESGADMVTTNHYNLRGGEKKVRRMRMRPGVYRYFPREILLFNPFPIVFALFKRSTIETMSADGKLFDESFPYTCDYELLIRLSFSGLRLHYLSEPLTTYRIHASNLSRQIIRMNRQAALVLFRHKRKLREYCGITYRVTMLRFMLRVLRNAVRLGRFDRRLFRILTREVFYVR